MLLGITLLALGCKHGASDDASTGTVDAGAGEAGVSSRALNQCGGASELRFAGRPAQIGEACGECADGLLVCGTSDAVVCTGAKLVAPACTSASAPGTPNACGGFEALSGSAPGAACGACGLGIWICDSPNRLTCYGGDAAACADAGAVGTAGDGGSLGSAGSGGFSGAGGSSGTAGGAGSSGAGGANVCGGQGELTWRGQPAAPNQPCGPCAKGTLLCAGAGMLTCGTQQPIGSQPSACESAGPLDSCSIPASAYTATPVNSAPAPAAETKPTTTSFQSLTFQNQPLPVIGLIFNAFTRRLYAGLGESYAAHPNSLAVIDPAAQSVLQFVALGATPGALALSDDGRVLWVAASNGLLRVDLATLAVGAPVAQGVYTQSIAVLPGTHDSVLAFGPGAPFGSEGTLRVYDNGVVRPIAATFDSTLVTATNSPNLAYGFNGESSANDLTTYCVDEQGVFPQRADEDLFVRGSGALLFDAGIVYGSAGAYDVPDQRLAGIYVGGSGLAVDSTARRIFTLTYGNLATYDMDTFATLANDSMSANGNILSSAKLVRWGRYGLAFTYSTDPFKPAALYVGRSALIP